MAAPAFGSIGTFTSGVSGTVSFPVPAGVASGDIIVIPIFIDAAATTITAMPSGFAHAENSPVVVGTSHSLSVVWKRATGSDAGTYDFTLSGSTYREGAAIRYSGCVASGSPWDSPTNSAADNTSGTVTPAVSVTTAGADRLLFFAGTDWAGGAWTPPTGFTERIDNTPNRILTADDLVQAVAGSSGSVTATSVGNDKRTAWLGALKPVAGGGGDATVTATVVAAQATVPAPTVSAGSRATPTAVAGTTTVPAPTVSAGSRATPSTVAAVAAVPAPTVSVGGSATVTPATVAATASIPAATVSAGSRATPAVVAGTTTVPAPTVRVHATVTLTTVAGVAAIATPTVSAQAHATVTPATVMALASVPAAEVPNVDAVGAGGRLVSTTPPGRIVHTTPRGRQ